MSAPARVTPRSLSAWVRRLRLALRLTQADFGRQVGVSGQTVWLWEAGRVSPRSRHLLALERLAPQVKK